MDPTKLLAVYTKKQEGCQAILADASNPRTIADMVQMVVMHAFPMGVMQDAYHHWKFIPQAEQNWNHWKEHCNDTFNELKKLNVIITESVS